jgi:glyoxylase-like metal-dependent hydrolase (beta-lactamase superfamily II)
MRKINCTISSFLLFALIPLFLQGGEELPINKKRLSDRVMVIYVGKYFQTIGVVALATEKGIVTIDSSLFRSHDARTRKAIAEEFGRDDFKYHINTHHHHDHTAGNQVFSDVDIIAHKNCPAGMREELTGEGLANLVGRFEERLKSQQEEIKKMEPGSREHNYFSEEIYLMKKAIAELGNGLVPTFPTILFEKNMSLNMGDMTVEIYSFGTTHTDNDILVFVPEEGLVALGDFIPGVYLPYVRKERMEGFAEMMEHWGKIVDGGTELKHVTMAHWDMPHSTEAFIAQYKYLKKIWDELAVLKSQGKTIEDAKVAFSIEKDFPYFKDKRTKVRDIDLHLNNIEVLWEWLSKKRDQANLDSA